MTPRHRSPERTAAWNALYLRGVLWTSLDARLQPARGRAPEHAAGRTGPGRRQPPELPRPAAGRAGCPPHVVPGPQDAVPQPVFAAFILPAINAVPIDQDGVGKEGIRTVLEQLEQGRAVLVFPEG